MISLKNAPDGHAEFEAWHRLNHPSVVEGCRACKLERVGLQFSYGREDFHGPTIGERQELQLAEARSAGLDPVPVEKTWS
jgi:hypothetical protein